MKVSGHIGMPNHKLSIPILHHLVKLKVPEQPAESERCMKFVAVWILRSSSSLTVCNWLINVLVAVVGKYC